MRSATGMLVRLVRYPAGVINPAHTHPCGHWMYVLEGTLATHKGDFGPGSFVWFPEGEVMEHGATAAGDVVVVFITNKPFRIDYVPQAESPS
jgi:quercetin dioxygenase-like cupin family protein